MDQRDVNARLSVAIEALFLNDAILLEYDVGERTVAAQLSRYLAGVFPSQNVDVEYNRHGLDPKAVNLPPECGNGAERLIVPDLVVHRRGTDSANLLAIEIKKETNKESRACDRAKVQALKRELGYAYGVLLELPAGPDAPRRKARVEWI
jgi:hypothetical protein